MYIHINDHKKRISRIHRFYWKILILFLTIITLTIYLPSHYKLERNILASAADTLRSEYLIIKAKQEILTLLRTKPLTVSQALDISDAVLQQQSIPMSIILAIIKQESQFSPAAVSSKGAKGLMQIMPKTWMIFTTTDYKQAHDPIQNINVGTKYLSDLHNQYGDWKMVFRAYYAGPKNAKNRQYDWYANAVLKNVEQFEKVN